MPSTVTVRHRILAVLRAEPGFVSRTRLLSKIGASYRSQANEQISQLLSEGVLVQTGLGKRGLPFEIGFNTNYPAHLCPCCGFQIPSNHKLSLPEQSTSTK